MDQDRWTDVDKYLVTELVPADEALTSALRASDEGGLPQINVAPNQGKLLTLLAKMMGARRILEIGTLGGYSTIWLARALPSGGHLVSLELEPHHADVARSNLAFAGLDGVVEILVGPAAASLEQLIEAATEPFDFIFIDADKEGYPDYLALSLQLARHGTVIVADNVVRNGDVIDAHSSDERVHGVRSFLESAGANANIDATAVQTVGSKGYDGFALLLVTKS
jgi:predicted O-methyltransferase YrrM